MTHTDFHARAELYLGSDWHTATAQGPRSFATAAQAVRFAIEDAAPVSLRGARLLVGDSIFTRDDLVALYRAPDFPLPRKGDVKRSRARRIHRHRARMAQALRRTGQTVQIAAMA